MSDPTSAIRARCEAATPGVWVATYNVHGDPTVCTDARRVAFSTIAKPSTFPDDYGRANCEFIAAARQDVLTLLDVNDRLLAEIERLNAVIAKVEALARAAQSRGPGLITIDSVRAVLATEVKPNAVSCRECGHQPHGATCFNYASDNDCDCHLITPAATEVKE